MNRDEPLIVGSRISVRRDRRRLLDAVDIELGRGEIVTLIGPNGAGKTTLVRVLLGLARPDSGLVRRRPGLRVGYAPQALHIDPIMPIEVRRFLTLGRHADQPTLTTLLGRVGLPGVQGRQMSALSGGELRRVLLARALLARPHLLVLDEPVSGVDVTGQADLYGLLRRIRDETGAGILLVSHDLHLVMAQTDRVVCLEGHVCCAGRPLEVTRDPDFRRLFGHRFAHSVALYRHEHDHVHEPGGAVLEVPAEEARCSTTS